MRVHDWQAAAACWQQMLESDGLLSAEDYAAAARAEELLGNWQAHDRIVQAGLADWSDSPCLLARDIHAQARARLASQDWDAAALLFASIPQGEEIQWPCAVNYHRRQVRFQRALHGIGQPEDRLRKIEEMSLFRAAELLPQKFAGVDMAVECMDWPGSLHAEFLSALEPLLHICRTYDTPLRLIDDPALSSSIASLALVWERESQLCEKLPNAYIEMFARLFLCHGFLSLYASLRGAFVKKLSRNGYDAATAPRAETLYRVALANERGSSKEFERLCLAPVWDSLDPDAVHRFLSLSHVYHDLAETGWRGKADDESGFHEYVAGKSIAIVGPVDVGLEDGEEIDSFERVVRFNFRDDKGYDPKSFGVRTDISYYVKAMLVGPPLPRIIKGMAKLDYAVANPDTMRECKWIEQIACPMRESLGNWNYLNNPMLFGYAHGIQRAIFDLSRFSPGRIKVFCADLYTSMQYPREYLQDSTLGRNGGNIFPGLSLHDPVSNFLLMHHFARGGWIETDAVLSDVLALSVEDYIDRLRISHSPWVRPTMESC
jgi:hypothetical protein